MKKFHVKHSFRIIAVVLVAFAVAACSASQTDNFIAGLTNFNRGVAAVDQSIQQISSTLYRNCTSLQAVGQAAVDITGQCAKASPIVSAVNDVINGYCQAEQVTNIASAVATTASTVNATKSQLSAAKQSCATGG